MVPADVSIDEPMFSIKELEYHFEQQFRGDQSMRLKVKAFFFAPDIYGRYPSSVFYIGMHPESRRKHILVPLSLLKLEMLPQMKEFMQLSDLVAPTPADATAYVDLESVTFETELAFQHKSAEVTKYNRQEDRKRRRAERSAQAADKTPLLDLQRTFLGKVFVAVDVECWEQNNSIVVELGWAVWRGESPEKELYPPPLPGALCSEQTSLREERDKHIAVRHFIVAEHYHSRNGMYVPDEKFGFLFGDSKVAGAQDVVKNFISEMAGLSKVGEVILVGHDIAGDLAALSRMGVKLPQNLKTMDTKILNRAYTGTPAGGEVSLQGLVRQFDLDGRNYHNAGNDAYYTMKVFREYTRVNISAT
ncbi:hypothetical protein RI367_001482 [Sorochytrium milnesiophthora]